MMLVNVNLDDITCIMKFEYPIQVAFGHYVINKKDLNLNKL
jgi:hypothetical protein